MKRLAAIALVLPLWACASQSGGPFERAGRNADEVVEDVREGTQDVIEDVREAAEDVGDDVRRRRR
jgi:alkanesulfonate monooxygenase SsuD/methylene tetrahydromethanopterin reductase-like flavin-dependent oxidoreductase (luciferase family)